MTPELTVADMASYLRSTPDWHRIAGSRRSAQIWEHLISGRQVMVPVRDDMADRVLSIRMFLDAVSEVEERSPEAVALDVTSPLVDTQSFRMMPPKLPSGQLELLAGNNALQGIATLYTIAGRSVSEGRMAVFSGKRSTVVGAMMSRVLLAPSSPGSYVFNVRVNLPRDDGFLPMAPDDPLERQTVTLMDDAADAARQAVTQYHRDGDLANFDATVPKGVSANLCRALALLSAADGRAPFEIRFGWARGIPAGRQPRRISFPKQSGQVLRRAAQRIERLVVGVEAELSGPVEELRNPTSGPRHRIKIDGELTGKARQQVGDRPVWVQLTEADYDLAVGAHREHRPVSVWGELDIIDQKVVLNVAANALVVTT